MDRGRAHYTYLFSPGPIPTRCGFEECCGLSSGSAAVILWPPKVFFTYFRRQGQSLLILSYVIVFHGDAAKSFLMFERCPFQILMHSEQMQCWQWVGGYGSWITWVNKSGWVTWIIGMYDQLTRDPLTDD